MAYRRKQNMTRSATFVDYRSFHDEDSSSPLPPMSPSSTSASTQAIRASAAHRETSLSSAYGDSTFSSAATQRDNDRQPRYQKDSNVYEYTSMKSLNEPKSGFWGVLAKKAKDMLDDGNPSRNSVDNGNRSNMTSSTGSQSHSRWSADNYKKSEPNIQERSEPNASSLRGFGGNLKTAFEEGMTIVENRTAGIIQETKKLQIRRKSGSSDSLDEPTYMSDVLQNQVEEYETQLKSSRDVANVMAAKAKLLLRELKTVKADLAFTKQRCAQLEEENKIVRESREKGSNPADDDLIRLQLETLLAEKSRLIHENSVYARENRFLREIVEYHQLTMQDVVYLDEGNEEVTEVYRSSPAGSEHGFMSPGLLSRSPTPNPVLPSSPKAKHASVSRASSPKAKHSSGSRASSPNPNAAPGSPTFHKTPPRITTRTLSAESHWSPSHSPDTGDAMQQETSNTAAKTFY